jgi:hypothetical protein
MENDGCVALLSTSIVSAILVRENLDTGWWRVCAMRSFNMSHAMRFAPLCSCVRLVQCSPSDDDTWVTKFLRYLFITPHH